MVKGNKRRQTSANRNNAAPRSLNGVDQESAGAAASLLQLAELSSQRAAALTSATSFASSSALATTQSASVNGQVSEPDLTEATGNGLAFDFAMSRPHPLANASSTGSTVPSVSLFSQKVPSSQIPTTYDNVEMKIEVTTTSYTVSTTTITSSLFSSSPSSLTTSSPLLTALTYRTSIPSVQTMAPEANQTALNLVVPGKGKLAFNNNGNGSTATTAMNSSCSTTINGVVYYNGSVDTKNPSPASSSSVPSPIDLPVPQSVSTSSTPSSTSSSILLGSLTRAIVGTPNLEDVPIGSASCSPTPGPGPSAVDVKGEIGDTGEVVVANGGVSAMGEVVAKSGVSAMGEVVAKSGVGAKVGVKKGGGKGARANSAKGKGKGPANSKTLASDKGKALTTPEQRQASRPNSVAHRRRTTSNHSNENSDDGEPPKKKAYIPSYVQDGERCVVCLDNSTGTHYRAMTCEGCKGFFRRTIQNNNQEKYVCKFNKSCVIDKTTRNQCQYCRYQKCIKMKMDKDAVLSDPDRCSLRTLIHINRQERMKKISMHLTQSEVEQLNALGLRFLTDRMSNFFFFSADPNVEVSFSEAVVVDQSVSHLFRFIKGIPGVDTINPTDVLRLTNFHVLDILGIRLAYCFDNTTNELVFSNFRFSEATLEQYPSMTRIFKFAKTLAPYASNDGIILGTLAAMRFFCPDNIALSDDVSVGSLSVDLQMWLLKHMAAQGLSDQFRRLVSSLVNFENIRDLDAPILARMAGLESFSKTLPDDQLDVEMETGEPNENGVKRKVRIRQSPFLITLPIDPIFDKDPDVKEASTSEDRPSSAERPALVARAARVRRISESSEDDPIEEDFSDSGMDFDLTPSSGRASSLEGMNGSVICPLPVNGLTLPRPTPGRIIRVDDAMEAGPSNRNPSPVMSNGLAREFARHGSRHPSPPRITVSNRSNLYSPPPPPSVPIASPRYTEQQLIERSRVYPCSIDGLFPRARRVPERQAMLRPEDCVPDRQAMLRPEDCYAMAAVSDDPSTISVEIPPLNITPEDIVNLPRDSQHLVEKILQSNRMLEDKLNDLINHKSHEDDPMMYRGRGRGRYQSDPPLRERERNRSPVADYRHSHHQRHHRPQRYDKDKELFLYAQSQAQGVIDAPSNGSLFRDRSYSSPERYHRFSAHPEVSDSRLRSSVSAHSHALNPFSGGLHPVNHDAPLPISGRHSLRHRPSQPVSPPPSTTLSRHIPPNHSHPRPTAASSILSILQSRSHLEPPQSASTNAPPTAFNAQLKIESPDRGHYGGLPPRTHPEPHIVQLSNGHQSQIQSSYVRNNGVPSPVYPAGPHDLSVPYSGAGDGRLVAYCPDGQQRASNYTNSHSRPQTRAAMSLQRSHPTGDLPHPCQALTSFSDLPQPRQTSSSFSGIPHPRQTSSSFPDLPNPRQTSSSFPDLPNPRQTSSSFLELLQPRHISAPFPDLPNPRQTSTSFPDLPNPRQTSSSFPDLPNPRQTSSSFSDLPQPRQSSTSLIDLPHPRQTSSLTHRPEVDEVAGAMAITHSSPSTPETSPPAPSEADTERRHSFSSTASSPSPSNQAPSHRSLKKRWLVRHSAEGGPKE